MLEENIKRYVKPEYTGTRKNRENKYKSDYRRSKIFFFYRREYEYSKFTSKFSNQNNLLVKEKLYFQIINDMFDLIMDKIVHKSEQFKLPLNLGYIGIKKKKMNFNYLLSKKYLKIDYKSTKDSGVKVYHTNDHTNNFRYRWKWDRSNCRIKGNTAYTFVPTRWRKREAAQLLKKNLIDYTEEKTRPKYIPNINKNVNT